MAFRKKNTAVNIDFQGLLDAAKKQAASRSNPEVSDTNISAQAGGIKLEWTAFKGDGGEIVQGVRVVGIGGKMGSHFFSPQSFAKLVGAIMSGDLDSAAEAFIGRDDVKALMAAQGLSIGE